MRDADRRARVPVDVDVVGETRRGRNLYLVKIGDPSKTPVMIMGQQHGNEPTGFSATVRLIAQPAGGAQLAGVGQRAADVLDELYVLVMPQVNPDGAAAVTRGNTDFDAPPRDSRDCFADDGSVDPSQANQGRGVFTTEFEDSDTYSYDINRYHWPDWSASWQIRCNPEFDGRHFDPTTNPVPEAVAALETYEQYQPIWVVDVHNQGLLRVPDGANAVVNEPGADVTSSVLWPTNGDVAPEAVDLSKQLTLVMKGLSLRLDGSEMTRYEGGDFPGIARNAYGLLGSARVAAGEPAPVGGSVLLEVSGQAEDDLSRRERRRRSRDATKLLWEALSTTADGSLYRVDPALAELLILPQQERLPSEAAASAERSLSGVGAAAHDITD